MDRVRWRKIIEGEVRTLTTWQRGPARHIMATDSTADLIECLANGIDPNLRITTAELLGRHCGLFDKDERLALLNELAKYRNDLTTNEIGYHDWQCDDDAPAVAMGQVASRSIGIIEKYNVDSELLSSLPPGFSFDDVADCQRAGRVGCIYDAGQWAAHSFCVVSQNVGILHSVLPTDIEKAGKPGFHEDHAEFIVAASGVVLLEFTDSLDADAKVMSRTLSPGEYQLLPKRYPHRISAQIIRTQFESGRLDPAPTGGSFLAVKCGELKGKSREEDMTQWGDRRHPLIDRWLEDVGFLNTLSEADRDTLCLPPKSRGTGVLVGVPARAEPVNRGHHTQVVPRRPK